MSGPQRMMALREMRPTLTRRIDSLMPTEAPLRDTTMPSAAPRRPAYLRLVDPAMDMAARTVTAGVPLTQPVPPRGDTPAPASGQERQASADAAVPEEGAEIAGEAATAAIGAGVADEAAAAPGAERAAGSRGGPAAGRGERGAAGAGAAAGEAGAAIVPLPETGTVLLPDRPLTLPPVSAAFDAPRRFTLVSLQPVKERTPDIEQHAALFEAAIETAARFAADLLADTSRDADDARTAERRRGSDRQRNLDAVLGTLDASLAEARSMLAAASEAALMMIDRRSRLARMRIGGAASRAHARRTATIGKINGDVVPRKIISTAVELIADVRHANIKAQGDQAAAALGGLAENPSAAYPLDGGAALVAAQNEAIVDRLPPRATERKGKTAGDAAKLFKHLQPVVTQLHTNITGAFQPFDAMVESLNGAAKDGVNRARDGAWKAVRDTRKALRAAVEQGRTSAEIALIEQHGASRKQMIDGANMRTEQERTATERSAAGRVSTGISLAGTQSATVRALVTGLEPQRNRPPQEFATIVVRSARGLQDRIDQTGPTQRAKLARSVPQTIASMDQASSATSARMLTSAAEIGRKFTATADATGTALHRQVEEGTESFASIAQPVAQSIVGYVEPIEKAHEGNIKILDDGLRDARTQVDDAFAGRAGSGTNAKNPAPPPAPDPDAPKEAADAFVERVAGVARDPKTETEVAAFENRARGAVRIDVQGRASKVSNGLKGFWGPDVETVMTGLRGLTKLRANALKARYAERPGVDIVAAVQFGLSQSMSAPDTIKHNIEAAQNYLNGEAEKGALSEMQAAVNLWNDEARVERVQRSLSPAQMSALSNMPEAQEVLQDIHDDLEGHDREVFDQLRQATPESIGRANSIRLQQGIDKARETYGYRGSDKTVDVIVDANRAAGSDRLSGADEFPELEPEGAIEARRKAIWNTTVTGFAERNPLPADATGPRDPQAALVAYATNVREYDVFVPSQYQPSGARGGPPRGRWEKRNEGIGGHQHTLIENVVRDGPDSASARGARMAVEMNRPGGRPDPTRLAMATGDDALNPAFAGPGPEGDRRRAEALATNDQALMLYWQYTHPGGATGPPPPPEAIRAGMQGELLGRYAGDPAAGKYAVSLVRDPRQATNDDYADSAVSAINYALSRPDADRETLRRTFQGLSFEQAELANDRWNAENPGGPSLYARLGIAGQGNYWGSIVSGGPRQGIFSGDEALELERDVLGRPTTDRDRYTLATVTARQQIRESSWLGRTLAAEEYGHLQEDYANLLRVGGVTQDDFDPMTNRLRMRDPRTGQPVRIGRFSEDGGFIPPVAGSTEEFEAAMDLAKTSAQSYTMATDRIAAAITTALVVIAAVVTTVLTAGAAASIWIPVLVTAGAGLVGMGLTAAIKGGRYSRDEMARDLAMTIITAATAGIGAAAGVALRGGMPALRAAAGSLRVSEGAMKAALSAGGRTAAMRATLTLTEEVVVGGVTNGLNGMGAAAFDPALRRSEDPGGDILHAGFRGFLGGAAGAAAMRPFARFANSNSATTRAVGRSAGQAVAGSGTRATEIAYEGARGKERRHGGEIAADIFQAGAVGAFQGLAESRAEDRAKAYWGRREAAAEARAAGLRPTPSPEDAPTRPPPTEAAPGPETVPEAPAPRRATQAGEKPTTPPRRPMPPPAPEPAPARPPRLPGTDIEAPQPALPRSLAPDDEPTLRIERPTTIRTGEEPEPPTLRRPAPTVEEPEPPTLRRPRPEGAQEPEPRARRRPPPVPGSDRAAARRRAAAAMEVVTDLPEASAMMPPDPRSRAQAEEMFRNSIAEDPSREVGVYVNSATGEHILIQGSRQFVLVDRDAAGNPVGIMGEGNPQRWKEILDSDRGQWLLLAHNHPGNADASRAGFARRLPSGRGGDFTVLVNESALLGGQPRNSAIHVTHDGRTSITEFFYEPGTPRPFGIFYDDPATGQRVFRRFASLEGYGEFFENLTGISPNIDRPGAPATVHQPQSIEMLHGTHSTAAASIRAEGIQLAGIAHEHQDFGRAFYLTLDEPNANRYATDAAATQRARARGDTPDVVRFTFRLEDLGDIVDVRPGGPHREQWEAFLALTPPHPALGNAVPAAPALPGRQPPWRTARDYIMSYGITQRGVVFEQFLNHINMAHAPVVRGDLGGVGTSGRVAQPGEQIAIRTQEAADQLSAAMRAATVREPPVPAAPVPASVAPLGGPEGTTRPGQPRRDAGGEGGEAGTGERPPPRRGKIGDTVFEQLVHATVRGITDQDVDALIARLETTFPDSANRAPAAPRVSDEERAAIRQRPIDDVLAAMEASDFGKPGADRLREMLLLGGEPMRGVVLRETAQGRALAQAKLETRLGKPLNLTREEMIQAATLLRGRGVASPLATVARWSYRGMQPAEIADFIGSMQRLQYDPQKHFGFGTHRRRVERRADAEAARAHVLGALDTVDGVRELPLLRSIMQGADAMNDRHASTLRWADGSVATHAGGTARDRSLRLDLVAQWHAYLDYLAVRNARNPNNPTPPSADGFHGYISVYNKLTQRPRIDEIMGVELAAQPVRAGQPADALQMGLLPLRVPTDYTPSLPGIDSLGLRPSDGAIVIIDSKAHTVTVRNGGLVHEVSAFFPNLIGNMRTAAGELRAQIAMVRAAGQVVRRDVGSVPARLDRCARELARSFPGGIDLSVPGAPARVQKILRDHNIELVVTTNVVANPVRGVGPRLASAGVRFLRAVNIPREPDEEEK